MARTCCGRRALAARATSGHESTAKSASTAVVVLGLSATRRRTPASRSLAMRFKVSGWVLGSRASRRRCSKRGRRRVLATTQTVVPVPRRPVGLYGWGSVVWGTRSGLMIVVALLGPLEQWYGGAEPMAGCTTKEQGRPLSLCITKATRRTTTTAKATSTAHPRRTPRRVTRANSKVFVGSATTVPRYVRGGPGRACPRPVGPLSCGANTVNLGRRVVAKAASACRLGCRPAASAPRLSEGGVPRLVQSRQRVGFRSVNGEPATRCPRRCCRTVNCRKTEAGATLDARPEVEDGPGFTRPDHEAVAAMTAVHDPTTRRLR